MTRRGKIARLPKAAREVLNQRLDHHEEEKSLGAWLNSLQGVIPIHPQAETSSLVFRTAGFVPRSCQIALDLRLARDSRAARNPARLNPALNVKWNKRGKSAAAPEVKSPFAAGKGAASLCPLSRGRGRFEDLIWRACRAKSGLDDPRICLPGRTAGINSPA